MSELSNWLQYQEDEDWEDYKKEEGNGRQTKAALLSSLGLAASLGVVAVNGNDAKADEQTNSPGQELHDLLLCTYNDPGVNNLAGTLIDNPENNQDQEIKPDPWTPFQLSEGTSQKIHKGYVIKMIDVYGMDGGTSDWRVFKKVNGQDVEVGILNGMGGQLIGLITDSGIFFSGGNLYKVTDTGQTLVSQEIGELPLPGIGGIVSKGGYIFANYTDNGHEVLVAFNEQEVLNHVPGSGEIPIASVREISTNPTSEWSLGMDVDDSTGELVIAFKQGLMTADLTPFLDADGNLPPDFSLADVELSPFKNLGVTTVSTAASNGYKYLGIGGGTGIIMQTPNGQDATIDKEQLNGGTGVKLSSMYELVTGGIYIIFDNSFDSPNPVPPVVLHEDGSITQDPGDMTPFIKKCFVIPAEEQAMFDPPTDLCADVTCPAPAEQCKASTGCDPATGDCGVDNKPDGTACNADMNACTVGDSCQGGQCAPGAPKICEQPQEPCKESTGCEPATGNCGVKNKPDETTCDDGNPQTKNDQCAAGVCEGTPIENPDTVEPNPEPNPEEEPDVVEQEDTAEPEEDVIEEVDPNPEEEPGSVEEVDSIEPNPEEEPDVVKEVDSTGTDSDIGNDANNEVGEDNSEADAKVESDTGAESEVGSDNSIPQVDEETPGKPPGCSCNTVDTPRQQRGVKETAATIALTALALLGLRRKKKI